MGQLCRCAAVRSSVDQLPLDRKSVISATIQSGRQQKSTWILRTFFLRFSSIEHGRLGYTAAWQSPSVFGMGMWPHTADACCPLFEGNQEN
jgi:hypothetical protein